MKKLNKQVEWAYMQKVLSQAPQYAAFAVCVDAVALAAASGAFEEKAPATVTTMSSKIPMIASVDTSVVVEQLPPTF